MHVWACPNHPHRNADGPGLCSCGRARTSLDDVLADGLDDR